MKRFYIEHRFITLLMTKVAILIPCHISYEGQFDLLDNCIISLLGQTLKPKSIYVSISFENEIYKTDFKSILQKYGRITIPRISFRISKEKRHQMEHLHNISSNINDDYDMLMFCDDDDTYHIDRVSAFITAFNHGKNNYPEKLGGVREHINLKNNDDPELEIPEYWCYGIVPNAIADFFSFFKGNYYILLQHKFSDMYFRHYLRKNSKYYNWVGIIDEEFGFTLYNYNINNPNSICGRIERGIGDIGDNILLKVLDCRTEQEFDNIMKKNKIIYKLKCSFKHIYNFCKLLYT
jgi:hypothetical protein